MRPAVSGVCRTVLAIVTAPRNDILSECVESVSDTENILTYRSETSLEPKSVNLRLAAEAVVAEE